MSISISNRNTAAVKIHGHFSLVSILCFSQSHPEYIEENQTKPQVSRLQASALTTRFLLFLMSVLFIHGE